MLSLAPLLSVYEDSSRSLLLVGCPLLPTVWNPRVPTLGQNDQLPRTNSQLLARNSDPKLLSPRAEIPIFLPSPCSARAASAAVLYRPLIPRNRNSCLPIALAILPPSGTGVHPISDHLYHWSLSRGENLGQFFEKKGRQNPRLSTLRVPSAVSSGRFLTALVPVPGGKGKSREGKDPNLRTFLA